MLEIIISDTLIKFHASGFFLWLLIFALVGSVILNGLKIHTWILDRKLKKMKEKDITNLYDFVWKYASDGEVPSCG